MPSPTEHCRDSEGPAGERTTADKTKEAGQQRRSWNLRREAPAGRSRGLSDARTEVSRKLQGISFCHEWMSWPGPRKRRRGLGDQESQ